MKSEEHFNVRIKFDLSMLIDYPYCKIHSTLSEDFIEAFFVFQPFSCQNDRRSTTYLREASSRPVPVNTVSHSGEVIRFSISRLLGRIPAEALPEDADPILRP